MLKILFLSATQCLSTMEATKKQLINTDLTLPLMQKFRIKNDHL